MARHYLAILSSIVRSEVDPLFKIEAKRLLDLDTWKRRLRGLGLDRVYADDVELELVKRGVHP